jgi:hypothetical protein
MELLLSLETPLGAIMCFSLKLRRNFTFGAQIIKHHTRNSICAEALIMIHTPGALAFIGLARFTGRHIKFCGEIVPRRLKADRKFYILILFKQRAAFLKHKNQ